MANIAIRNLSPESKARLRQRAEQRGAASRPWPARYSNQAAEGTPAATGFPHDLIALVEPGEDIEPFLREHAQPQEPVDLP